MKRDFLKQQVPDITDEQITAILNENGNDLADLRNTITQRDQTIQTLTTERDGFKNQLEDRDKDIKELQEKAKGNDDLTKQLGDLQTKYDTDTKELQRKLDDQAANHATEAAFAGVNFASALAKKAAIADFKARGYKLGADGKYAEAESYIAQLKKDDPAAFKAEEEPKKDPEPAPAPQQPPRFTGPMNGQTPPASGKDALGLSFNFVRKPPKAE